MGIYEIMGIEEVISLERPDPGNPFNPHNPFLFLLHRHRPTARVEDPRPVFLRRRSAVSRVLQLNGGNARARRGRRLDMLRLGLAVILALGTLAMGGCHRDGAVVIHRGYVGETYYYDYPYDSYYYGYSPNYRYYHYGRDRDDRGGHRDFHRHGGRRDHH